MTEYQYNDGGRKDAGYKGNAGDCVVRAIAITARLPYESVRQALMERNRAFAETSRSRVAKTLRKRGASTRNGNFKKVYHDFILSLGFTWVPTMHVGSGSKVHFRKEELPRGRLILRLSKHLCAFVDGVVHDISDPSREGKRAVYGYYEKT